MAFLNEITRQKVNEWKDGYEEKVQNPNETLSFLIQIQDFRDMFDRIKTHESRAGNKKISAIRIYFIRTFDLPCARQGDILSVDDDGAIPQLSGLIMPAINLKTNDQRTWEADDLYVEGVTFGIVPGDNQGTGHNPPGPKSKTGV